MKNSNDYIHYKIKINLILILVQTINFKKFFRQTVKRPLQYYMNYTRIQDLLTKKVSVEERTYIETNIQLKRLMILYAHNDHMSVNL